MIKFLKSLFLLFCFLVSVNAVAQFSQIRFEKLDIRDGLSHNRVNSICEDQLGFIWFATRLGLNRYDGNKIKNIKFEENDPFSPRDPNIVWMKEGPGKFLWMKTYYGVFAYDVLKERFVDISKWLSELEISNNLTDIVKDSIGNYWFIIEGVGVKKYLADQQTIYHYGGAYRNVTSIQPDQNGNMALIHMNGEIELVSVDNPRDSRFIRYPEHIGNTRSLSAHIDQNGDFWFYSSSASFGVCFYKPSDNTCRHFDQKELGSNLVTGILQDESERIIVGIDHGGLAFINKQDWSVQNFKNNPSDPKSLSHNSIISLYQDQAGLVWIGTHKGGVNYFSPKSVPFSFYKQPNAPTPNANDIWPLLENEDGTIWMGTDGGGLVHFNMQSGEFTNYSHQIDDPASISSNIVVSLSHAATGGLWVGTYFGGLNYFDGKKFKRYFHDPNDPNSITDNSVWVLHLDSRQQLWIGTVKGGVDVYDPDFKKIHHFGTDNRKIHSNYVTSFCEDKDGKIWIGTGYGLEVYDPETEKFTHILKKEGDSTSLNSNSILDIFCDQSNNMWIGTMYGLNKFDRSTGKFQSFTKEDGLPENIIGAILQDEGGDMWFSAYKGLSKLNLDEDKPVFENFDVSDGLQGDMFNERSALRLRNGNLAFGGKNGLNLFDPEDIKITTEQKKLVFLNFYLSNHHIRPGDEYNGRKWFEQGLNNTEKIVLRPSENSFTIEFASLRFYQQENTVYKYRLVGFDDEWVVRPDVRRVDYTNLYPGTYRFEVTAADQNQRWNDQVLAMNIEVLTPLWKTPIAYLSYLLIIGVVLFLTRRAIIQKERFRAKIVQDRLEARRLHELDLMKIKFFTNISHEFRTPLTLILTPIERLLKMESDPKYQKAFQLIYRNARRLLTLINQLLDFRKMEANQHKLSLSTGDLVEFLRDIVESFSDLANDRQVRLIFNADISEFFTRFDRDKMEKILFNLLSNALKFTPSGGKVEVQLKDAAYQDQVHTIRISVADTGIGIPGDRVEKVFDRFFQLDNDQQVNLNHGSGIGLSITKEFVEMHEGKIWLDSKVDVGSTFIVEVPMKKLGQSFGMEDDLNSLNEEGDGPAVHEESKPTIILVDDNADFRFYLRDNLKDIYNIYEAPNGKLAWKKISEVSPDLVVADIMMPELNGVELCKKIKNNPRTAPIPVILLTAHYSDDQKLQGYEAGAIEYITKPFNFEILIRAIRSALQLQKQIHASERLLEVKAADIKITSRDEEFINRAMELVEQHISNADYSVQELSKDLAVSRGQLYKKTLELTGQTPIEFIRSIRIKRSAALLEKSQLNVAEVAYRVGFNNPKYFTKYFKKEYKVLPSKYAALKQEK